MESNWRMGVWLNGLTQLGVKLCTRVLSGPGFPRLLCDNYLGLGPSLLIITVNPLTGQWTIFRNAATAVGGYPYGYHVGPD